MDENLLNIQKREHGLARKQIKAQTSHVLFGSSFIGIIVRKCTIFSQTNIFVHKNVQFFSKLHILKLFQIKSSQTI